MMANSPAGILTSETYTCRSVFMIQLLKTMSCIHKLQQTYIKATSKNTIIISSNCCLGSSSCKHYFCKIFCAQFACTIMYLSVLKICILLISVLARKHNLVSLGISWKDSLIRNTVKATGSSARLLITYSEFYCSIVTKKAGIITQYRLLYKITKIVHAI